MHETCHLPQTYCVLVVSSLGPALQLERPVRHLVLRPNQHGWGAANLQLLRVAHSLLPAHRRGPRPLAAAGPCAILTPLAAEP